GDGGERYPKATINVTFPDGRRRRERVTEHSKWRADDVATKGRCTFEIADLGAPEFGEHPISDISVPLYADGTSEAWTLDTGTSATVVLHKPPVAVIDSGLCFAT